MKKKEINVKDEKEGKKKYRVSKKYVCGGFIKLIPFFSFCYIKMQSLDIWIKCKNKTLKV